MIELKKISRERVTEAVIFLTLLFTILNVTGLFTPNTFSKEEVDMIVEIEKARLERDIAISERDSIIKEIIIIEQDNERLQHNISEDSVNVFNSSRSYRDSIRSIIFGQH